MDAAEVRRLLEETQALLNGHFQLSSGLHSDKYFQCARVLAWPARASLLGVGIGSRWADEAVDAVKASETIDRVAVRASVVERFDSSRMVDDYLTVYRGVVELHSARRNA